jgi:Na+/serine symporter
MKDDGFAIKMRIKKQFYPISRPRPINMQGSCLTISVIHLREISGPNQLSRKKLRDEGSDTF